MFDKKCLSKLLCIKYTKKLIDVEVTNRLTRDRTVKPDLKHFYTIFDFTQKVLVR